MKISSCLERTWRRCIPPALEAMAPALIVAGNAVGAGLQAVGVVEPAGPKILPPNLIKGLPPVVIDRPVLLMPGYNTTQDRFDPLAHQLAQPGFNGGRPYFLKGGQVFLDSACSQAIPKIPADAKVFVCFTQRGADPPPVAAQQLGQALDAVRKATGAEKVDVAAYSMGGLTTRYYLQQGGDAVGKFLMVGTPNQGSQLAESALKVLDLHDRGWPVQWIMSRKPFHADHREAQTWLLPPESSYTLAPLKQLNATWPQQLARVEKARSIGTDSEKTYDRDYWRVTGDGQVTTESRGLPGLDTASLGIVPYPKHRFLFSNPQVQQHCRDFFGWSSPPQGTPP